MGKSKSGRVLPILFNANMVRAILDGRKTETRRLIRPRYKEDESGLEIMTNMGTGERWVEKVDEEEKSFDPPRYINPPYQPGDILYVRETWSEWTDGYVYKAWTSPFPQPGRYSDEMMKWHPSIHMPMAAARIWLKVTGVKVKHLYDMDLDDFLSEGVTIPPGAFNDPENAYRQARSSFITIWNSTIKKKDMDKYGWEADPWVWVIEFKKCEKPESEG